jgi:hypothetical protein
MFRLFRKLRGDVLSNGKTRQYLSYAIGEIILVVFGILIALQINNWNEERIEQRQITEYAHALVKDLERDLAMVEIITIEINLLLEKIDMLASYVEERPIDQIKNIDLFYLMREPFYRPYAWNRTALEQIKSSGALRQMKNQQLAEKISAYEALTYHLEGDFEFDRSVGTSCAVLASQVVDMNYANINEFFPSSEMEYFSFPELQFYEAYKDSGLSLLTDDIEDIKLTVNAYLILGGRYGIRPRAETEMPKLAADASELIELLRAEYPE